jgi:thiol-disulfide isomerase/thioredoxin
MKIAAVLLLAFAAVAVRAAELLPIEKQVVAAVESEQVTVVHFWAPWCSTCRSELASNGWSNFLKDNPKVKTIFVTVWQGPDGDGRPILAKHGVGPQKNFALLVHPNSSIFNDEKMRTFMGQPVHSIPATWIYRGGKMLYALNYGEMRFAVLQQLVHDATKE